MRYFLLICFIGCARTAYSFLKLLPTQRKVVLISRKNTTTSISFGLLEKEIKTQHPKAKVVVLNHRMRSKFSHIFDVIQEMYHLATAQGCIVDSYVIAVSILNHKRRLKIIQVWHALGAIKAFGHMTVGRKGGSSAKLAKIMRMHKNYTYVAAASQATVPIFAKAFDVAEDKIKICGLPRIDYLLDDKIQKLNAEEIKRKYPQTKGKKIVLYLPTFRKREEVQPDELINAIDANRYALIIKQHYLDKTLINKRRNVIIANDIGALELLPAADYVVTDYSAAAFEAAVLEKPLFFWAYDIDKYRKNYGFALDYRREMPGVISKDAKRIAQAIEQNQYDIEKVRKFKHKYVSTLDKKSTKRIVELLSLD